MTKIKSNPVKTVLTIVVGFTVIYLLTKQNWALIVALIIGILGLFSTYLSGKIDWLWMKLTWILSMIVPNILLSLVFFLILFPLAMFKKLFSRKDVLLLKDPSGSVYSVSNKKFEKMNFERPW